MSWYLRHDGVGGDDVLHLLGPGVHEAEPPAPQRDEGAILDLELVTVGVDLLSHLQHWEHKGVHVMRTQIKNTYLQCCGSVTVCLCHL